MAINPLQLPEWKSAPMVDWSPLGRIGDAIGEYRRDARMKEAVDAAGGDPAVASRNLFAAGDTTNAMTAARFAEAVGGKLTDEMREYNLARSQGEKRNFTDWKTGLKAAGATKVQVNSGERSFDQSVGKAYGDQYVDLMKAGRGATAALGTLDYMDQLVQRPDFYSGTGAGAVMQAKRALSSMGIAAPDSASAAETFEALSNKLVLDAAGGSLGAQISNADRDFLMRTAPGLGRTPEGNRELIGAARRIEQRKQEVARLAREYAIRNGGRIDAGFDAAMADWAEKNPLFPQRQPGPPSPQGEAPAAPAGQPQVAQPPAEGARQAPDGRWYVPDPRRPGKYLQVQ